MCHVTNHSGLAVDLICLPDFRCKVKRWQLRISDLVVSSVERLRNANLDAKRALWRSGESRKRYPEAGAQKKSGEVQSLPNDRLHSSEIGAGKGAQSSFYDLLVHGKDLGDTHRARVSKAYRGPVP